MVADRSRQIGEQPIAIYRAGHGSGAGKSSARPCPVTMPSASPRAFSTWRRSVGTRQPSRSAAFGSSRSHSIGGSPAKRAISIAAAAARSSLIATRSAGARAPKQLRRRPRRQEAQPSQPPRPAPRRQPAPVAAVAFTSAASPRASASSVGAAARLARGPPARSPRQVRQTRIEPRPDHRSADSANSTLGPAAEREPQRQGRRRNRGHQAAATAARAQDQPHRRQRAALQCRVVSGKFCKSRCGGMVMVCE
jgi:hypothetical protein